MKNFLYLLILLFSSSVFTQEVRTIDNYSNIIDSLKLELKKSATDSSKCLYALKIAGMYKSNGQTDEFLKYSKLGKKYALKSPFLTEYTKYFLSLKHLNDREIDLFIQEIKKIQKNLKKFNNEKSTELQLIITQNLSTYYQNNNDYKNSIQILTDEGINLAKKSKNNTLLALFYESIGRSFFNINEYNKSNIYYSKALQSYKKSSTNKDDLIMCYVYMANNLILLDDLDQAKLNLNYALAQLKDNTLSNAYSHYYYVCGHYSYYEKKFNEAVKFYLLGLQSLKPTNSYRTEIQIKISLSEALMELNRFEEAMVYLKEIEPKVPTLYKLNFLNLYSRNFESLNDFKAAHFVNKEYIRVKDSIDNESKRIHFIELEAKYNTIENENKILNLEKENQIKEIELQKNQTLYSILFSLILIGMISFLFLLKNLKNLRKINSQKDIIHHQKIQSLKNQKEIEIMYAMIEGEEAEKKRISRDLHDGIGSSLTSIKMKLEYYDQHPTEKNLVQEAKQHLTKTIKELRQIAYNLIPETLNSLGLDAAIKDYCMMNSTKEFIIEYNSFDICKEIKMSHQISIYRIVQELINNAIKHSYANHVFVQCSQNDKLFLITVEDNGIGMHNESGNKNGMGLTNIKKRVEILDGNFEISSTANNGIIINIELHIELD
ncbi:MAG TPA: sensor histidine kinase [Flavobacterium sp.]|uniref:tetratricopeptide repeat-containing sensor histidine kinase n=1 Tax=unclassified Flavobacterium TaxID=196869 RepID=UPI0025C5D2B7|nr:MULTISPECIES: sensor histidine kinase [unclassified Flavobacterium]HRE76830.1 sensor histidine kinase [Flavobacterium sp.]